MNQFKRDFDQEKALKIIRKALVGIGSPNFDDGTGLEKKSGLTNIKLENDDFVKEFKDSILPEQMKSFASLEKTILTFDLNNSSYTAELKMGEFRVRKTNKAKVADCYKTADFDLQYVLTGDEDTDKAEIEKLIKQGLEINVDELNGEEESDYGDTVMGVSYDGAYCFDDDLAHLLFNFLAKQLGFIRVSEAAYLNDLFMIDNTPIRIEKIEQVMRLEFEQTFKILKENGHDEENEVESNDMDNYLFYVEKGDIQGCVYRSQNNLFLVAKNTKTGVLKAWNTLQVFDDWFDWVSDSYVTNENDEEVFDVAVFLQGYTNAKYGNSYDYPFEFNTYGYRKSFERLMSNFEIEDSELIYDSERGFMPSKYIYFNSLVMEVNYSVDLMTDEYGLEKDLLVLTEQDINTPDYFMRSMQNFSRTFSTNRASMLYYLFLCGGNGIFWNGKTFTTGDTFNGDYPEVEEMKDYGPLGYTNPIRMMAYSAQKMFDLPEDMSNEWKQAVFELCFYMKEWIEESEKNSFEYGADTEVKETIESCYDKYYDESVLDTIQKARAS